MKKFLAVILCFVYVVASSGATINFHYCMGRFIGADLNASSSKACENCGMNKEQKKGCCNEKHATIQLKKDQLASTANALPLNQFVYLENQNRFSIQPVISFNNNAIEIIHSPPLIQTISPFLMNCVFKI